MKAFVVDNYKKKGPLRLADMPEPEMGDDDVLVRIQAAAINQLDSKLRDGEFKLFLPYRPAFHPWPRSGRHRRAGRRECAARSRWATRSSPVRAITASAPLPNSSPSDQADVAAEARSA